jgi:hypothetical protein
VYMIDTALMSLIVTIVFTCFTISISIAFFYLSNKSSKSIEASVDKLNEIHKVFTFKTFEMLDKAILDYQKHAWREIDISEQIEQKLDERVQDIPKEMTEETMEKIKSEIKQISENEQEKLRKIVESIPQRTINEYRNVEREISIDAIEYKIMEIFNSTKIKSIPFRMLTARITYDMGRISIRSILIAIKELQDENQIQINPPVKREEDYLELEKMIDSTIIKV